MLVLVLVLIRYSGVLMLIMVLIGWSRGAGVRGEALAMPGSNWPAGEKGKQVDYLD